MKKIIVTLTVIAAAALGAQGQTTNTFYYGGTTTLAGLTLTPASISPASSATQARLLFSSTSVTYGSGNILFSGITLSGDGITGSLTGFGDVTLNANGGPVASGWVPLTTPISSPATWNTANSLAGFSLEFRSGATAPSSGSQISYFVQYADTFGFQLNTGFGNVALVAVPEPSAYAAAAGLLALFLWSSRRHLFKLAGARSSASGPSENGAA